MTIGEDGNSAIVQFLFVICHHLIFTCGSVFPTMLITLVFTVESSLSCAVPALVSSSERAVYPAPAESITLTAQFQGVGISGVEWRHNGTRLRPQNGIMITVDGGFTQQATLTILQFNSSAHSGQYDIIVENPVGLTILAVWEVLPAGESACIFLTIFF